jgi:RNA polymerase sigma-70 factor (ECF subfamily)
MDEKELFRLLAVGNEGAFKDIYNLWKERVYCTALKFVKSHDDAEDILQQVFLSLWVSREKLPYVENQQAYIFTIVHNKISTYFKSASNRERIYRYLFDFVENESRITDEQLAYNERNSRFQTAVNQLPEQQKRAYLLSRQDGLSNSEIAEAMDLSINTVKSHIAAALKTLRKNVGFLLAMFGS